MLFSKPPAVIHEAHHGHGDELFATSLEYINRAAGFIILFAACVATLNVALLATSHFLGSPVRMWLAVTQPKASVSLDRIKLEFGRAVAFSLLVLVAADVIETLIHPLHDIALNELYKMGIMGALRTTLAYFLGKELEEMQHHLTHSDGPGAEAKKHK